MNNSNPAGFFLLGIFTGIIIFSMSLMVIPGTKLKTAETAIEECEKTLPRNQHCIITAIPEEK